MGALRWVVAVAVAFVAYRVGQYFLHVPPLPRLDPKPWWGLGEPRDQNTDVRPFKIDISQEAVDDLKARLALSPRIAPSLLNSNFTYGFNSVTLNVVLTYWQKNYDWRKREQRLNKFSHFKTRVEGLDIHFVRATPPKSADGKTVRPLLLLHGWPGSFVEFYDVIPLLTTPRDDSDFVFDVICPSLPGYGFSDPATKPGLSVSEMSQIFVKLMVRLGFDKFYAQGGDWGSIIVTEMATFFPDKLLGIHLNMLSVNTPITDAKLLLGSVLPSGVMMDPKLESKFYPLKNMTAFLLRESGYMHLHATKPDTIGVALNNSPQGLAAYILEKFSTWTNKNNVDKPDGGLLESDFPISLDTMLDNICVYWFSGSITSSMRLYAETLSPNALMTTTKNIPTAVPTGIAAFPEDLLNFPVNFAAAKFTNIISYTTFTAGGHFAAMEVPVAFAADVHKFVNMREKLLKKVPSKGLTGGRKDMKKKKKGAN